MLQHLDLLHTEIANAIKQDLEVEVALEMVLLLTLKYFQQHQQIIKLFFLLIVHNQSLESDKLIRKLLPHLLRSLKK